MEEQIIYSSNKQLQFAKTQRLINKSQFRNIFNQSYKIQQKNFVALFKQNQKDYSRLGLIISKRVANSSVIRNRIKRVIRESFRVHQIRNLGFDIVIITRHQCDTFDKTKLHEGINKLWEKLQSYQH